MANPRGETAASCPAAGKPDAATQIGLPAGDHRTGPSTAPALGGRPVLLGTTIPLDPSATDSGEPLDITTPPQADSSNPLLLGTSAAAPKFGIINRMDTIPFNSFRSIFDLALDGVLPDALVEGSVTEDYVRLLPILIATKAVTVSRGALDDETDLDVDHIVSTITSGQTIRVRPQPDLLLNFFTNLGCVGFDFDIREIRSQTELDHLCQVIATVGESLASRVHVSHEGCEDRRVFHYDPALHSFVLDR